MPTPSKTDESRNGKAPYYTHAELVEFQRAAAGGDPVAQQAMVDCVRPLIWKIARHLARVHPTDAEDLFSEGVCVVLEMIARRKWNPDFAWTTIVTIVVEKALGQFAGRDRTIKPPRLNKKQLEIVACIRNGLLSRETLDHYIGEERSNTLFSAAASLRQVAQLETRYARQCVDADEISEKMERVNAALLQLPTRMRAIVRRRAAGTSYAIIAQEYSTTPWAAQKTYERAINQLRAACTSTPPEPAP